MMDIETMIQNARTLEEMNAPELGNLYRGKVRDNYSTNGKIIMIATDRTSCFDFVLSRQIPFKGQVLTELMCHQGDAVSDIIPYHVTERPDPQVAIVDKCELYDIEIIIRSCITGSLWRHYVGKGPERAGEQYGLVLPSGLRENQKFDEPIVTPTTKAKAKPGSKETHHDEPVSREEIITTTLLRDIDGVGKRGESNPFYIGESEYDGIVETCMRVFRRGQEMSLERDLLLVDTKYELGNLDGELRLVDEVHTPDSSRFWHADRYQATFEAGEKQKSLSKEFVREWLIKQGYNEAIGESSLVRLTDEVVTETAVRYIDLCERLTGKEFVPGDMSRPIEERILENLKKAGYA